MKKKQFIFLFVLANLCVNLFSQKVYNSADVFSEKNIVWYGIDFTHCKFIGQPTIHGSFYKEPDYIVKNFFRDWNLIPLKEGEKYNLEGTFDKEYVYYDIDSVMERNKRYNSDSLIAFNRQFHMNPLDIPFMINSYSGVAKEGIGVVYIVDNFNHDNDLATFYSVIFDVASKKILFQEKITGKASGGSVKTFWAGAFRNALEKNHKVYRKWKKEAMVK